MPHLKAQIPFEAVHLIRASLTVEEPFATCFPCMNHLILTTIETCGSFSPISDWEQQQRSKERKTERND